MEYDATTGWWWFDTVREFWEAQGLEGRITCVKKDGFWGILEKGVMDDGGLRRATANDKRGHNRSAIVVKQVHNENRPGNYECLVPIPPRTGKFDAFMDEVEATADLLGLQYVWVKSVFNKFLPSKLLRRGYRRIDRGFGHPDFIRTFAGVVDAMDLTGCGKTFSPTSKRNIYDDKVV